MAATFMVRAEEIARDLDISKALAHRMIHDWNAELRAKGYTTVQGRVTRKYYEEQIYGLSESKKKEE